MDVENEVGSDDSLTMMNTIGNVDVVDDDSDDDNDHIVDVSNGVNEHNKAVLVINDDIIVGDNDQKDFCR